MKITIFLFGFSVGLKSPKQEKYCDLNLLEIPENSKGWICDGIIGDQIPPNKRCKLECADNFHVKTGDFKNLIFLLPLKKYHSGTATVVFWQGLLFGQCVWIYEREKSAFKNQISRLIGHHSLTNSTTGRIITLFAAIWILRFISKLIFKISSVIRINVRRMVNGEDLKKLIYSALQIVSTFQDNVTSDF